MVRSPAAVLNGTGATQKNTVFLSAFVFVNAQKTRYFSQVGLNEGGREGTNGVDITGLVGLFIVAF